MDHIKYLKSRKEYSDQYDKFTIDRCRRIEKSFLEKYPQVAAVQFPREDCESIIISSKDSHKNTQKDFLESLSEEDRQIHISHHATYVLLFFLTQERGAKKEKTINDWIVRDTKIDQEREILWNKHQANNKKRCRKCGDLMKCTYKDFSITEKKKNKILFMYECIDCRYREGEFDDGEILKRKKSRCPKCKSLLNEDTKKTTKKISFHSNCTNCEYNDTWEVSLTKKTRKKTKTEIETEKLMEKDRIRFCISEKKAAEFREWSEKLQRLNDSIKKNKELEKIGESPNQIKNLEKIPILIAQKRIKKNLKNKKFLKTKFSDPEVNRYVIVNFKIYEGDETRKERNAINELKKIIEKSLDGTNWKLMSDGINSRMGIFSGRIRAIENHL